MNKVGRKNKISCGGLKINYRNICSEKRSHFQSNWLIIYKFIRSIDLVQVQCIRFNYNLMSIAFDGIILIFCLL